MNKKAISSILIFIIFFIIIALTLSLIVYFKYYFGKSTNIDDNQEEFGYLLIKSVDMDNGSLFYNANYSLGYSLDGITYNEVSKGSLSKDAWTEVKCSNILYIPFIYGDGLYTNKQYWNGFCIPKKIDDCKVKWNLTSESNVYLCSDSGISETCDFTKYNKYTKTYECYYTHTKVTLETEHITKSIKIINNTELKNGENNLQIELSNAGYYRDPSICLMWSLDFVDVYLEYQDNLCNSMWNNTYYDFSINKTKLLPTGKYYCKEKDYVTDCTSIINNNQTCIIKGEIPKRLENKVMSCKMIDAFNFKNTIINIHYKAENLRNGDYITAILFDRDQSFVNGGSFMNMIYEDSNGLDAGGPDYIFKVDYIEK